MNFVELNRIVETRSECILFLYLLDAHGAPLPNVRMRIWAGPPPTGKPPYYEDEDPNNLNRRTDLAGKFQFIVANPAPEQPLDFYVQVVNTDDIAQSTPVHFPFPPHEAYWITVTMGPEVASAAEQSEPGKASEQQTDRILQPDVEMATRHRADSIPGGTVLAGTDQVTLEPSLPVVKPSVPKLFTHYMLFGPGSQPGTMTSLIIALDYIIRFSPLVGFSPDEAKNSEHVTLVGDTSVLSYAVEQSLRDAGCIVTRLSATDSYALENVFKKLVDSASPYPTQ